MVTNNLRPSTITIEEFENITDQIRFYETNDKEIGVIICPRCNKYMHVDTVGASHCVQCDDKDCIGYTARGL
jgi:hypothetical protein